MGLTVSPQKSKHLFLHRREISASSAFVSASSSPSPSAFFSASSSSGAFFSPPVLLGTKDAFDPNFAGAPPVDPALANGAPGVTVLPRGAVPRATLSSSFEEGKAGRAEVTEETAPP
eukprot:CAMPEP_0183305722 /NCGR_PEP_ID=MMETSP0160_2-20130417/10377_1 /TAXON_ID=2839 ORGANISM="Odontella Sinensis, Strain Grunow 1884" /NCGR_SAMPLE_ID=MMETSP0160_2 /ASSEMBLY_ACC=CAM_ASM_000250 /LENGTH=116 /DNA_ID=CAMNT_0025468973 /DNA_START=289 /DNA_END=636 /DNA_ORIENTATION=+